MSSNDQGSLLHVTSEFNLTRSSWLSVTGQSVGVRDEGNDNATNMEKKLILKIDGR